MAKEKEEPKKGERKPKRKHLHEIRTTQAKDGSLVHHHTYSKGADDDHPEPERGPMATSASPDDAGAHVAEQFGMNQMGGGEEPAPGEGEAPPPAAGGGGTPEAE